MSNGTLTVATSDPFDLYAFDELRLLTGLEVQPVLAPEEEIDKVIKAHYGVGGDTIDEMMSTADDEVKVVGQESSETEDLLEMAQEASVIKLVNEIFLEALNERASDIHIEPYENDLSSATGSTACCTSASMPPQIRRFQAAIISRIKIMANLNIAEKRLPQDGRIKFQVGGAADRRPRQRHPDALRRGHRDAYPRQGHRPLHACRSWAWPRTPSRCSRTSSSGRTASCW